MFLTSLPLGAEVPEGSRSCAHPRPSRLLTPFWGCPETLGVVSPSVTPPAKPAWAGKGALGVAALILGAVLLSYWPAHRGGFVWDDDAHVTRAALRSLSGLGRIWFEAGATQQYYPLAHSAFWLEHRLWGDWVTGYHLANLVEHAAAAWLVWAILARLSFPAPLLAALLFALHPVEVESVAWISEQKNTLSAVLYLASAWVYLRFDDHRRRTLYSAALGLFVLALLTKSVTATLPAALLVVLWWRRGRLEWRRDVRPLVPWMVLGAASGLFTAWVERTFIGAQGADFAFTLTQRLFLSGRVLLFYLRSLAWPAHLMFIYPRWDLAAGSGLACGYLLAVLLLAAALVFAARRARGPLAGFLFFAGTLVPALGFVNVYPFRFSFVADHFQYLASLGILVPTAWGLAWVGGLLTPNVRLRAALMLVFPAFLGVLTWRQAGEYRDAGTLYHATLAENPAAWLIHYNLAVTLGLGPAHRAEAISEYRATVRLKPDHWEAHNNLASALLKEPGQAAEAIAEYREAIRYDPRYPEAENNLGVALENQGETVEAEAHLRTAIRLRPDYAAAHANLGNLLRRRPGGLAEAAGEYRQAVLLAPAAADYHYDLANALSLLPSGRPEAIGEYRAALALNPGYAEAHSNLGVALSHTPGQADAALAEYRKALALDPGSAKVHANLASALARRPGGRPEALGEYAAALRIDSSDPATHYGYGLLLAQDRARLADAIVQFRAAAALPPELPEAHYALGVALAMTGDRPGAVAELERALALRPDFALARSALRRLREGGP